MTTFCNISDLFDDCRKKYPTSRWTVGIHTDSHEMRNAKFMFSLLTEGSGESTLLSAHKRYDANVWTNVAASYDGQTMRLNINGAKISNGHNQKGAIYSQANFKCKVLILGGNGIDDNFYRGHIDEVRLWNRTLQDAEIVESMYKNNGEVERDMNTIVLDEFNNLNQWRVSAGEEPAIVESDIPLLTHHMRLESPACGQTVCDDPEAVMSYLKNPDLRNKKVVRYRIVNVLNDDGTDPLLSSSQIQTQHEALSMAYEPYNIAFIVDVYNFKNSSVRESVIMFDCFPHMIGDGECNQQCAHSSTGNDGGDCDQVLTECFPEFLGNGRCDAECNKGYHEYDQGDCCLPGTAARKQCIDPDNPLR